MAIRPVPFSTSGKLRKPFVRNSASSVFLKLPKRSFLYNVAVDTQQPLSLFTVFVVNDFSAIYLFLLLFGFLLHSINLFSCCLSSSTSEFASETSRVLFSTSFIPFTPPAALQSSHKIDKAHTPPPQWPSAPSSYKLLSLKVPLRSLHRSAHHFLCPQFKSSFGSSFFQPYRPPQLQTRRRISNVPCAPLYYSKNESGPRKGNTDIQTNRVA